MRFSNPEITMNSYGCWCSQLFVTFYISYSLTFANNYKKFNAIFRAD